jgi:hypothetical protein
MEQQFRRLAGTSGSDGLNTCPTVIEVVDSPEVIVQGRQLDAETRRRLNIPEGEDAVWVPKELYLRGANSLTEDG